MRLAKEHGFSMFETSAKTNNGINYMFNEIGRKLYDDPPKPPRKDTIMIHSQDNDDKKSIFSKILSYC